ncbi:DEAD/DEAH box helicase, partial [Candidatus Woesearchaeota archaeon]|nr:DEAD/DEAH box helicase [Candidatus Woesearchaeota archaeon]
MLLSDIKDSIPKKLYDVLLKQDFKEFRPCQEKSIKKGLLEGKNLVVCTPTASGKTWVAKLAAVKNILEGKGKAIYIVPLKALATEKYNEFKKDFPFLDVALSIGDLDSSDPYLERMDIIITTSEKMDSLIRHRIHWLSQIHTIIVDETHLINDTERGPTLEILITMLRQKLKNMQIIALSATIGNPEELAEWLNANLVIDKWRPVKLHQGTYLD